MVRIKGSAFLGSRDAIKEYGGEEAYQKVLAALSQEDRQIVAGVASVAGLYPLDVYVRFLEAECKTLYNSDEGIVFKNCCKGIEKSFKGIYRIFLQVGSPQWLLKRLSRVTNQYFEGMEAKVEILGEGKIRLTYIGFKKEHAIFENMLKAWWVTFLKLMGKKNINFDPKVSIAAGQATSEYILTWTDK